MRGKKTSEHCRTMVAALERGLSASKSFNFKRMFDSSSTKQQQQQSQSIVLENVDSHLVESNTPESQNSDSLAESPVESMHPMISPLTRPGKRSDKQQAGVDSSLSNNLFFPNKNQNPNYQITYCRYRHDEGQVREITSWRRYVRWWERCIFCSCTFQCHHKSCW